MAGNQMFNSTTGIRVPICDIRYLLMPAKIKPMHVYEDRLMNSTSSWNMSEYNVMHDTCVTKTNVPKGYIRLIGKVVNNARAVCVICRLEYDATLAKKERDNNKKRITQIVMKRQLLGNKPTLSHSKKS